MYDRTIQMSKQNRHKKTANYRRLSGIELPWTLREGLSLDIKRLSWINNSLVSEQEERILKSSKLAEWPVVFMWEKILDMTGLDDGCPVIGVSPRCSDTLVCKWRMVWPTYNMTTIKRWMKFCRIPQNLNFWMMMQPSSLSSVKVKLRRY
jgi:hypothetical protein